VFERACLLSLIDAREKLEGRRQNYNQVRPHSALADLSPAEFVRTWQQSSATLLRMAGPVERVPVGALHGSAAADPKLLRFSAHPSSRGGAEKLPDSTEQTTQDSDLLEVVN
jgi:hypothetical protein